MNKNNQVKYYAFISYSHKDNKEKGRQWATWLQQKIETYEIPTTLVGKKNDRGEYIPARIYPVFRDEEELTAEADLSQAIIQALDSAHFLIVLCSPRSAKSSYVADEIKYFKKLGYSDQIVIVIIDGEPNVISDKAKLNRGFKYEDECFPNPFQTSYDDLNNRTSIKNFEPIVVDFRIINNGTPEQGWTSIEDYNQYLKNQNCFNNKYIRDKVENYQKHQSSMLLKIIARLLGVSLSELTQRDKNYQFELERIKSKKLRQWFSLVILLMVVAFVLGIVAYCQKNEVEDAKKIVERIKKDRTYELFESKLTHAALLSKIQNFAEAKKILYDTHNLDSDISIQHLHTRNFLNWYIDLMGLEADCVYQKPDTFFFDISPDGKTIAVPSESGTFELFNEFTGEVIHRFDSNFVRRLIFHPNGNLIISGGEDKHVTIWSLPDGIKQAELNTHERVTALAIHPKSNLLASTGKDNTILLWNIDSYQVVQTLKGHESQIMNLAFSHNGLYLASASGDRIIRLWDMENYKTIHVLKDSSIFPLAIDFHPIKDQIVTGSENGDILFWSLQTGQLLRTFHAHDSLVFDLMFLTERSNYNLVSASDDRTLRIWDTDTGVVLRILHGHQSRIVSLKTKGSYIYSSSEDGTIRRWKTTHSGMHMLDVDDELTSCALSPDGHYLAIGVSRPIYSFQDYGLIKADGSLHLFSLRDDYLLRAWKKDGIHTNVIQRLSFLPDGKSLITASCDNTSKLIQLKTIDVLQIFKGHNDSVSSVSVSGNGNLFATASYDGRIGLFQRGKVDGNFVKAHDGKVYAINIDCTENYLVSAGDDGKTKLWQLKNDQLKYPREIAAYNKKIFWADFSPDGRRVVSVGEDQLVHVFDVQIGKEIVALAGHENTIYKAAFTPDGYLVISASEDGTIRIWDIESRTELFNLRLPVKIGRASFDGFSFNCTTDGDCIMAVLLTHNRLVVFFMDGIFDPNTSAGKNF